jgi:hypothetical protein
VPRDLRNLPWCQVAEDFRGLVLEFVAQARDFLVDIERLAVARVAKLLDLSVQFGDRLFKIKKIRVHSISADFRDTRVRL